MLCQTVVIAYCNPSTPNNTLTSYPDSRNPCYYNSTSTIPLPIFRFASPSKLNFDIESWMSKRVSHLHRDLFVYPHLFPRSFRSRKRALLRIPSWGTLSALRRCVCRFTTLFGLAIAWFDVFALPLALAVSALILPDWGLFFFCSCIFELCSGSISLVLGSSGAGSFGDWCCGLWLSRRGGSGSLGRGGSSLTNAPKNPTNESYEKFRDMRTKFIHS